MKPISAFLVATLAGIATFVAQAELQPSQLHAAAAAFVVPNGPDWRQKTIDRELSGPKVDKIVRHLEGKLDLTPDQASKFRPILENQREQTLALLLNGPRSLTRDQFMARQQEIMAATHKQLDALLTPDQLEIVRELRPALGS